jgi:hypothetical protein
MKWEYRVALFRWRSDVWHEVNNLTDELDRALRNERRFQPKQVRRRIFMTSRIALVRISWGRG